jgi:hypothetical protein
MTTTNVPVTTKQLYTQARALEAQGRTVEAEPLWAEIERRDSKPHPAEDPWKRALNGLYDLPVFFAAWKADGQDLRA